MKNDFNYQKLMAAMGLLFFFLAFTTMVPVSWYLSIKDGNYPSSIIGTVAYVVFCWKLVPVMKEVVIYFFSIAKKSLGKNTLPPPSK
ncbi:hypothetical protein [Xenorhabdus bovienii]|uniref:hypothetical protein n=1 Tax=Xenorhabdus bovienii TaxID=40576 RepID=UPI00056DB2AB|nr:hypothetical protein [Xenorhabdus bovienii]